MHHHNATYAAMVESLDQNVGRILKKIDELGIADRTVIFLTSDNGGFIIKYRGQTVTNNAPLRSGKGSLWEGGVRVPLLIRWPGVTPSGATCTEPVASTDFYPTILQMARLEGDPKHNAAVDGLSLVPLLEDPQTELDRDALYFHYPHYYPTTTPVSSVRARDWKLLEFHEDEHVELFNLRDDPSEERDLAGQMPERAEQLRRRLHAWREAVDAQMAEPNPDWRLKKTSVSGRIWVEGWPVVGALVRFRANTSGPPDAVARTDDKGRFTLSHETDRGGLRPGEYTVTVEGTGLRPAAEPGLGAPASLNIARRYADSRTSGLMVKVKPGKHVIEFHVETK